MDQDNGTHVIEPIEHFLRSIVDVDRLSLYQQAIDVIKKHQKFTMIEALNSILVAQINESGSELCDEIHQCFIGHIRDILLEYDLVIEGNDLAFLIKLAETMHVLDVYEEHEYFVNLIGSSELRPVQTLYNVLCVVQYFDEEDYHQHVKMCSMSLLDRLRDVHKKALLEMEDREIVAQHVDYTTLRKVLQANTDLIVNRMFNDFKVSKVIPVNMLVELAREYFEDYNDSNPKNIARELIGVFLVSGKVSTDLIETIRENMILLINDDVILARVGVVLNSVYVEMTA